MKERPVKGHKLTLSPSRVFGLRQIDTTTIRAGYSDCPGITETTFEFVVSLTPAQKRRLAGAMGMPTIIVFGASAFLGFTTAYRHNGSGMTSLALGLAKRLAR